MGTYFYQHPLLWCEDRKRAERKRDVEQDLRFSSYKKEIARMQLNQEREDVRIFARFFLFINYFYDNIVIFIDYNLFKILIFSGML